MSTSSQSDIERQETHTDHREDESDPIIDDDSCKTEPNDVNIALSQYALLKFNEKDPDENMFDELNEITALCKRQSEKLNGALNLITKYLSSPTRNSDPNDVCEAFYDIECVTNDMWNIEAQLEGVKEDFFDRYVQMKRKRSPEV